MKLTELEASTALWKKISDELQNRLQVMRERNDGDLPPDKTAELRGSIRMCKEILAWAQPDQQFNP